MTTSSVPPLSAFAFVAVLVIMTLLVPVVAPLVMVGVLVDAWRKDLTHRHGAALLACLTTLVYSWGAWASQILVLQGADEICGGDVARPSTQLLVPLTNTCHLAGGQDLALVPAAVNPLLLVGLVATVWVGTTGVRRRRSAARDRTGP